MKTIFTLLLLGIIGQSYAQTGRFYKGTINHTTKITLYLKGLDYGTHADPIVGVYKYDHQKGYILLSGYRNNNGHFSLVELASANFTGTFLGTFNQRKIVGK